MSNVNQCSVTTERRLLYSMKELSQLLGCSTVTAQTIKNSGAIPFMQVGRKCIFDVDKVLIALEQNPKSRK